MASAQDSMLQHQMLQEMTHGKKSSDFYKKANSRSQFEKSCHGEKNWSMRDSFDMTELNRLEESKYERLNDHIIKAKEGRKTSYT